MEFRQSELIPERTLGVVSQRLDLEAPNHISQRLAWPGDVSIDLVGGFALWQRRVGQQELQRLFAGPPVVMNPCVDHQPRSAPGLVIVHPKVSHGCGVKPKLIGESLGVERPSLDEGRLSCFSPPGVHTPCLFR